MLSTPRLIERPAQHYVAIPARVTMQSMMGLLPRLWPEVAEWLDARGIAPSGAPMIRWVVIDMTNEMQIEVGMPVAEPVTGDERVVAGTLPAGPYAVTVHSGHYSELVAAHAALQAWAALEGLAWAVEPSVEGDVWHARIESYTTDPAETPNPADWQTEIAYLVAPMAVPVERATSKRSAPKPKVAAKPKRSATKPKQSATKPKRSVKKSKGAGSKSKGARVKSKRAAKPKRKSAKPKRVAKPKRGKAKAKRRTSKR